jgi:hypothetical protein
MGTKKLLFGGVTGGVILFLLGWLIYGVLLVGFYSTNAGTATGVNKSMEEMNMGLIFLANLSWGFLMSFILSRWTRPKSIADGLKTGALVGILSGSGFDLLTYATTNIMTINGAIVDIVAWAFMLGIASMAIVAVTRIAGKRVQEGF